MKPLKLTLCAVFCLIILQGYSQTPIQVVQPSSEAHALSGWATAIDGEWAVIASPQKDKGDLVGVGELTVYRYSNEAWGIHQVIQPNELTALSNFGISVSLSGETMLVSSIGDHQHSLFSGVVFVLTLEEGTWVHTSSLKGSDVRMGHLFGFSTDIKDNLVVAGAYMGDGSQPKSGTAYVFEKTGEIWTETARLSAEGGATGDAFGYAVHIIDHQTIAIGANRAGLVYIFSKTDKGWAQTAVLSDTSLGGNSRLGYSIASVDVPGALGTTHKMLFSGAPAGLTASVQTGSVAAFRLMEGTWELAGNISRDDLVENSHFGISVASGGKGKLYVGASRSNSENERESGAVYMYSVELSDGVFMPTSLTGFTAVSTENFSHFGAIISASDDFIIISSPYMDRDGKRNSGYIQFYSQAPVSIDEPHEIIASFDLFQNYPNPFNPTTVIKYQLPELSDVRLEVFDILGRRVGTLVNGPVEAGRHEVRFDAGNLASGVYIYRLEAGGKVFTRKLTLIK